ncbi:MAG TPA: alpha/beta hydrolase [Bacillales bacterium]|nr:alpha/beta hydrolase [Bacillales bacterium]
MTQMTIDDVKIHYETYPCENHDPAGTLVLIHGYLSSTFSFRQLIPLLTQTYSVLALDLPGFGKSENSKAFTYSMANYGKLILSFMKRMQIDRAALVGHSMGGQVALQAVKQAPEQVTGLVLLASSGYLKPFNRWLVSASYLPFFTWIVRREFEKRSAEQILREVVYDPSTIDTAMIEGYVQPMGATGFYRSLLGLLRKHGGDLTSEELKTIHTPTLLIWGREDRIVPLTIGERLVSDLPTASLNVYELTGHLLPEEKPQEVFRDIQAFLP